MRRVVHELLGYKTMHMIYRGTSADDDSDSIEQIGGHPSTPLSHKTDAKRSAYTLNDEQLESALDLLSINSLPELSRQDFSSFGKKQSWIQLAQRCTRRLATDLLRLSNVGETAERCMLLHHRLESRKSQRIRTPNEAQNAIQTLYACCMTVRDVWKLSAGSAGVADVERTVGKIQSLMSSWRAVSSLSPVTPETDLLVPKVQIALSNVLKSTDASEGVKTMARRGLMQWGGHRQPAAGPSGTKVSFDSDDE